MSINSIKITIMTLIGLIGAGIADFFGGWDMALQTLIIFMAIDYATGLIVAGFYKKSTKSKTGALQSKAGWEGLLKKGVTLLFVLVAHRLDLLIGSNFIRTAVVIAYISNEAISIIENAGIMGLPVPEIIKKSIETLREQSEKVK